MLDLLFSPLTIRGKVIKNRLVVPPMLMNYCEEDGACTERYAAYMEEKAKGGFGLVGVEVANYLASLLKDVTIVEMREGIALDETPAPRKDLLRDIHNNGVRILTETSVKEIKDGSVVVTGKTEEEIPADTVVLAIGRVSNTVLADQLKEAGYDVRVIGDAHTPALAGAANREGHLTALSL